MVARAPSPLRVHALLHETTHPINQCPLKHLLFLCFRWYEDLQCAETDEVIKAKLQSGESVTLSNGASSSTICICLAPVCFSPATRAKRSDCTPQQSFWNDLLVHISRSYSRGSRSCCVPEVCTRILILLLLNRQIIGEAADHQDDSRRHSKAVVVVWTAAEAQPRPE